MVINLWYEASISMTMFVDVMLVKWCKRKLDEREETRINRL